MTLAVNSGLVERRFTEGRQFYASYTSENR